MTDPTYPAATITGGASDLGALEPMLAAADPVANTLTDSSPTHENTVRALRAARGLTEYASTCGTLAEEFSTVLGDALGDLRHLCDALGVEWETVNKRGEHHYDCELRGVV